jgi:hypothetical protein
MIYCPLYMNYNYDNYYVLHAQVANFHHNPKTEIGRSARLDALLPKTLLFELDLPTLTDEIARDAVCSSQHILHGATANVVSLADHTRRVDLAWRSERI